MHLTQVQTLTTVVENNLSKTPRRNPMYDRAGCNKRCKVAVEGRRWVRFPRIHVLFSKRGAGDVRLGQRIHCHSTLE